MMKEVWMLKNKKADFKAIQEKFKISAPLARILVNKGFEDFEEIDKFLHPRISDIPSYELLKDAKKAISIISKAIDNGEKIRIVGDYDVDGITSTYVLLTALEGLGAFVTYKIPDRIADGYGINISIIDDAIKDGIDLIVTCDNGIAAFSQIEYAKANGINVIVTDHHDIPEKLPPADAVVDPKQSDCNYPNKGICGAVVAAHICEGLYEKYNYGPFITKHFDVLALATICDVMDLVQENRIIAKNGLEMISRMENIGIKALLNVKNLTDRKIDTYSVGFIIGPCLNATGRLETADAGVELLRCTDEAKALQLAEHLSELNENRKEKTARGVELATRIIEDEGLNSDKVLLVYIPNTHESIAGIIAGRIKEKYNKPTICFTDSSSDGDLIKGSARSVEGYNIFEELTKCSDLLLKFGGHPMAAGLTIERKNLLSLRQQLNINAATLEMPNQKKLLIDLAMAMSYADINFVNELQLLEPMGNGNERPIFADKNVRITRISRFGKESQFFKLNVLDSTGKEIEIKMFNRTDELQNKLILVYGEDAVNQAFNGRGNLLIHLLYDPDINEYRGFTSVQIKLKSFVVPGAPEGTDEENAKKKTVAGAEINNIKKATIAHIFCSADCLIESFNPTQDSIVIAADAGYLHLKKLGIKPNYLLGDFDSLGEIKDESVADRIIKLPVEKDDTDSAYAVKLAMEAGCREIYLYGAIGGERPDHSFANISLLAYMAKRGIKCTIKDSRMDMTAVYNSSIKFGAKNNGDISVFAYGQRAEGVTIKGLKYELQNATLLPEVSLGVSNSFTESPAEIEVKNGVLIVMYRN